MAEENWEIVIFQRKSAEKYPLPHFVGVGCRAAVWGTVKKHKAIFRVGS